MENVSLKSEPDLEARRDVFRHALRVSPCAPYGMSEWGDLFTERQLVALTTFSDLVAEAREKILQDALAAGMHDDGKGLDAGGLAPPRMRKL